MQKALLISIKSQPVCDMYSHMKDIEVRTKVPNWVRESIEKKEDVLAFVYITKAKPFLYDIDKESVMLSDLPKTNKKQLNGTVAFAIIFNKIETIVRDGEEVNIFKTTHIPWHDLRQRTQISPHKMNEYMGNRKSLVGLLVYDMIKFENPKNVQDFVSDAYVKSACGNAQDCFELMAQNLINKGKTVKIAPQSMQTVWFDESMFPNN